MRSVFTTMPTVPAIKGTLNLFPGSKGKFKNCGAIFLMLGIFAWSMGCRNFSFTKASMTYSLGWMMS